MTQRLTERDVRALAERACVDVPEGEIASMTADLNSIIDSLDALLAYADGEGDAR